MINVKLSALCVVLVVISISSVCSQTESIILYNSQPIKVELSENGNIHSFVGIVPGYMEGFMIYSSDNEIKTIAKEEKSATNLDVNNTGYSVVSSERIALHYKPNFATLNTVIINKLNKIAVKLKIETKTKLLITVHTETKEESKLSANRLASAIAYLGIKGIHPDRIQSDIQRSNKLIDVIAINYLN